MAETQTPAALTWTRKTKADRHGYFTVNGTRFEVLLVRERYNYSRGDKGYLWNWEIYTLTDGTCTDHAKGHTFDAPVKTATAAAARFARAQLAA